MLRKLDNYVQKMELAPILHHSQMSTQGDERLKHTPETLKLLGENIREKVLDISLDDDFFCM